MSERKSRPNVTPLKKRKRNKNRLLSPFAAMPGGVEWSSWKDEHLPDMFWAALLASSLERSEYLEVFRDFARNAASLFDSKCDFLPTHSFFGTLDANRFEDLFLPLKANVEVWKKLRVLRELETLPDANHWQRHFEDSAGDSEGWKELQTAVSRCFDHQSQEATDVRWLKVLPDMLRGRMVFLEGLQERAREIVEYPEVGDMRSVRPSIRAMEMGTRHFHAQKETGGGWDPLDHEKLWRELYEKTPCLKVSAPTKFQDNTSDLVEELQGIVVQLDEHFFNSIRTTGVDARLDAAFGLVNYVAALVWEVANLPSSVLASGRVVLRTAVEATITLRYLAHKDDPAIWAQYRNYGSGQSALAYLKMLEADHFPSFVTEEQLEVLANEDAWFESKDIAIGNWANLNLRKMAEEASIKDLYDRYYDVCSGFAHAHWSAVRQTNFDVCFNPLHRLHRIPAGIRPFDSVVPDCCRVLNVHLDTLNTLFPTFKPRVGWHKQKRD